jgi:hypothetical protein
VKTTFFPDLLHLSTEADASMSLFLPAHGVQFSEYAVVDISVVVVVGRLRGGRVHLAVVRDPPPPP